MKDILMGSVIASKRKEKGITQDQLASYMGVSKTAVSKWETEQSYPDISLLPILASYFQISVDTLIGYKPQMSADDIAAYYKKMCQAFLHEPMEDVIAVLEQQAKKYHSCSSFLLYTALLYINHMILADEEMQYIMGNNAKELLQQVRQNSTDLREQRTALNCEAFCYLQMKQPKQALALLDRIEQIDNNFLLANAFILDQQSDKAMEALQADMSQAIFIICNTTQLLLGLYANDEQKMDTLLNRSEQIIELYDLLTLNPGAVLPIYIAAFTNYGLMRNKDKTYAYVKRYADALARIEKFDLQYGEFFDHINQHTFQKEIAIELPRDEAVIWKSCLQAVIDNPALKWLMQEKQLQSMIERIMYYTTL